MCCFHRVLFYNFNQPRFFWASKKQGEARKGDFVLHVSFWKATWRVFTKGKSTRKKKVVKTTNTFDLKSCSTQNCQQSCPRVSPDQVLKSSLWSWWHFYSGRRLILSPVAFLHLWTCVTMLVRQNSQYIIPNVSNNAQTREIHKFTQANDDASCGCLLSLPGFGKKNLIGEICVSSDGSLLVESLTAE